MDAVVPWGRLLALIEPFYPKAGPKGGCPVQNCVMQPTLRLISIVTSHRVGVVRWPLRAKLVGCLLLGADDAQAVSDVDLIICLSVLVRDALLGRVL
jgi:hypothetical protein